MNKLLILGCTTMREGVIVSLTFFLAGIGMILVGKYIVPDIPYIHFLVLALGLLLLLLTPLILISTFLLSVLPGAKKKLEQCEH